MFVHVYHSSSRFVYFLNIMVQYIYKTPVPLAGIFSVSMELCYSIGIISNLCVSVEDSEMKVEWTLLIAPICKSRH